MAYQFICYPKCTTCQKAKKWLNEHEIIYEERHIKDQNPSADELAVWLKKSGLPVKKFFNTSGLLYKSLQVKDRLLTLTDAEAINLLASDGMLVKRPILIAADQIMIGFKEKEWEQLTSK